MRLIQRAAGIALAGALAITLAACSGASGATSEDDADATPQTIAVMDPGAVDTIDALGDGDKIVGVALQSSLPDYLSEYKGGDVADLGSHTEPDLEKLAELDPDLVIVGFRTAELADQLSRNFEVIDVTYDQSMPFYEGVEYSTNMIAEALDKQDEAATELQELRDAIDEANTSAATDLSAMVLMTSGGKVSVHGSNSRYGAIYHDIGYQQAVIEVAENSHGDPISFEAIQEANPGILFVVDRDATIGQEGANAQATLDNDLVRSTDAWTNDRVVYLDGSRWYVMIHGVNNAVEMIREATVEP